MRETRRERAIRLFREACALLGKLPKGYSVYAASGTPCLMKGPSHDEHGRAQRENVVEASPDCTIDGGDW